MATSLRRPGPFSRIWASYLSQLSARPLRTKMITSGSMFIVGDTIAQFGIEGKKLPFGRGNSSDVNDQTGNEAVWDASRPIRLGFYGAFIFAPLAHTWLAILERVKIGTPMQTLATRLALDGAFWGPFIVSMFWTANGFLEGKTMEQVQKKVEMAFLPSWSASAMVFLPTQILNFTVVPIQHRLGVLQTVGLGWNIFLSYQNNINNRRLAEASARLLAAEEEAETLNIDVASILHQPIKPEAVTSLEKSTETAEEKAEKDVRDAEKMVEDAQKRRKELREEEGGGALGVGTRMGWS